MGHVLAFPQIGVRHSFKEGLNGAAFKGLADVAAFGAPALTGTSWRAAKHSWRGTFVAVSLNQVS